MKDKYKYENLKEVVAQSYCLNDVLKKLLMVQKGSNNETVKKYILMHNLDTSHFTGIKWRDSLNRTQEEIKRIQDRISYKNQVPESVLFIENSLHKVKPSRLIKMGWLYKCSICGIDEWLSSKITLHLDHINGDHRDNRIENLRFLCPNCHQQTETWGTKRGFVHGAITNKHIVSKQKLQRRCKEKTLVECQECSCSFIANGKSANKFCTRLCYGKFLAKSIPSRETLAKDFTELKSFVQVGKKYQVSDNAVRKWCKTRGLN